MSSWWLFPGQACEHRECSPCSRNLDVHPIHLAAAHPGRDFDGASSAVSGLTFTRAAKSVCKSFLVKDNAMIGTGGDSCYPIKA